MTVIPDVSGVVEILLHKDKANLYSKTLQDATLVVTPDLFVSELTNTIWKYKTANLITDEKCIKYILAGISSISQFIGSKEIWQEAFAEGVKNNHSIYDMFYMVTARRYGGILITNDSVLASICRKNRIEVCF